jgi:hypothetical protein
MIENRSDGKKKRGNKGYDRKETRGIIGMEEIRMIYQMEKERGMTRGGCIRWILKNYTFR